MRYHPRHLLFLAVVVVFALVIAVPVAAQEGPPQETAEDLVNLLAWTLTGVGALFLGRLVSFFAEEIPAFHAIPKRYKFPTIIAAVTVISLAIQAALTYTPNAVFAAIQPYWRIAITVIFALTESQSTYRRYLA